MQGVCLSLVMELACLVRRNVYMFSPTLVVIGLMCVVTVGSLSRLAAGRTQGDSKSTVLIFGEQPLQELDRGDWGRASERGVVSNPAPRA